MKISRDEWALLMRGSWSWQELDELGTLLFFLLQGTLFEGEVMTNAIVIRCKWCLTLRHGRPHRSTIESSLAYLQKRQ